MENKFGCLAIALFLCVASVELVWSASPKPSSGVDDCAQANRPSGYITDIKFPGGGRRIRVYDVDSPEAHGHEHPPVCLSKKANDTIFWTRGSGGKFKLKLSPQQDAQNCRQHPFEQDPPTDHVYGHLSGPLRPDAVVGCVYDVVFEKQGAMPSDPHIRVVE